MVFLLWNSPWSQSGFIDVNGFQLFADNDMDSTNGVGASLGVFNAANDTGPGPNFLSPKQTFNFGAVNTQFVQMQINSNHGGFATGFGEAAFTTVPEPTSFAFLGLIGVAVAGWQWKKRRNAA